MDAAMTQINCPKCNEYICDCTCDDVTGYSKKRRLLREHRKTMRVIEEVILDNGLHGTYREVLNAAPGDPQDWDVQPHPELDETSDVEDPEKVAINDWENYTLEMMDKEKLFEVADLRTARRAEWNKQVHLDMERARMEREDLRGQLLRAK